LKQKKILIFVLLLFIGLTGCRKSEPALFEVAKVLDGDTVRLGNGRKVRYLGIDTPELRKKKGGEWVYSPEPMAFRAKDYNRALTGGQSIRLEFDRRKTDKYGRWLAYVFLNGVNVTERLLQKGFGWYVVYPPNERYMDRFLRAQREARMNSRGIWKDIPVIDPRDAFDNKGRFLLVRGEVRSVRSSIGALYLELSSNAPEGLTGVIYGGNLEYFKREDISPERDYDGKKVEIFGKIRDTGSGTELVIYHPSQIKVL
jgi:micrococcal nuclease